MRLMTKIKLGRPKKHAKGTTASQRVAISTAALVESGGARKTFRLGKEANEAMLLLMRLPNSPKDQTTLIERLLIDAKNQFLQSATK